MAQLRIVRPIGFNLGMAYLRWGPVCERRGRLLEPEVISRIAIALHSEYVLRRKLFLRVLPYAFVGSPRGEAFEGAFCGFAVEPSVSDNIYRTLLLDLSPTLDELRRRLDKKWRNQLSRAQDNGLRVISGRGTDEYRVFCNIYKEMRGRKVFETSVDVEELGRMQADLAERHRMEILICEDASGPVAGLVASALGDSAVYLLGATGDRD